jgi:carboxyl-terminal processing protease
MKGPCILLAAIFCSVAGPSADAHPQEGELHSVLATVGQVLEEAQYSQRKLDAVMGKQILEAYLERLDQYKLFFTRQDIDQIRTTYSSSLDDDILLGNLTPAKSIFAIFRARVDERVARIGGLLKERHEFNSDRTVVVDRAKEQWPANSAEADAIWRDWIENELLAAKLDAADSQPGADAVGRRYRKLRDQVDGQNDPEVLRLFLEAMAQTYDPHSEYLGPSDLNQFKIDTRLTISGIGAEVRMQNGDAIINRIFPGGPAERSRKLRVGDQVVGVAEGDGSFVSLRHANLDRITELVLGKSGSIVRLQFIPRSGRNLSKPQVCRLVREEVRLTEDEAQAELVEMPLPGGRQKLGWVTVPSFYGEPDKPTGGTSVAHDVATLVSRLKREGIQGLVIDLRNNGGGSVGEAVKMTGLFIGGGPVMQLKDPNHEIHVVKEEPGRALYDGPMVVLDNKLTASASEIFSAAMQDYRRAVIVGDSSTFGKGTVQAVLELNRFIEGIDDPDLAGALKITIEKIYRVTGESTQVKGVISDVKIPSLTESMVPGENEQEHRLAYDVVAPAAVEVTQNGRSLFLEELQSRSTARVRDNPLFQDLFSESALANANTEKDRNSLNEKIRREELTEVTRIYDKAGVDRSTARARDRNKYYELLLAGADKTALKLISFGSRQDETEQGPGPDDGPLSTPVPPPGVLSKCAFDDRTENDAINGETLNILSDLVSLTRAQQAATGHLEKSRRRY